MPPVGYEPTISAGERPQTYALDRTATGTCKHSIKSNKIELYCNMYSNSATFYTKSWFKYLVV